MKILKFILGLIWAIISILSFAFVFIEGRLLLSGDWLVYSKPIIGFLQILLRLCLAFYVLFLAFIELINVNKNSVILKQFLHFGSLSLILMSIVIYIFAANFIGEIALVLSALLVFVKYIIRSLNVKNN